MIATMHKVFCSYAFTGEDKAEVTKRMHTIKNAFEEAGVVAYCNLFDSKTEGLNSPKEFIDAALEELGKCDIVFVVMSSSRRSEGMLIEIGAAYAAGKPIILARHGSANGKTYVDRLSDITLDWKTNEDLEGIIKSVIIHDNISVT